MNYKKIFSDEEWELLKSSFPLVFYLIAGADKKIDQKEKNAFAFILKHPERIKSKLASQILSEIDTKIFTEIKNEQQSILTSLKEISNILDNKLEKIKSVKFKKMLIVIAIYIAKASGPIIFDKMSHIEAEAINKIEESFNLSIEDLNAKPSVKSLFKKQIKKLRLLI